MGYRIIERLDASSGEGWLKYLTWSGLTHLSEVIGLDCALSPSAIRDFDDADYSHSVREWGVVGIFDDLEYTLSRAARLVEASKTQVIAVSREPKLAEFEGAAAIPGDFVGLDLIDERTWISALTNCGGFDRAFKPQDLSRCGLIESLGRAYEVRDALRAKYPHDHHADCAAWAIWRVSRPNL